MKIDIRSAATREQNAAAVAPQPLPPPAGEQRYQAALDADPTYQRVVLLAVALAFFAGTGFGRLPLYGGWPLSVLWCITAAGLATRCLTPRAAWKWRVEDPAALTHTLDLAAVLTAVFGAIALARSWPGPTMFLGAAAVAAGVWLLARAAAGVINPVLLLTHLAAAGWIFLAWVGGRIEWEYLTWFAVTGLALAVLQWLTLRRTWFAPIVATVALIHLGAAPSLSSVLHEPLWAQLACAALEFGLLAVGGYRHAVAGLLRLPAATYRVAPLCIVPRLDRAWDHPVKINVVA